MRIARPLLLACALGAAPLLAGCVAAAIPALAIGGVVQSQRHATDVERTDAQPASAPSNSAPTSASMENRAGESLAGHALADTTTARVVSGPLPPPDPSGEGEPYAALYSFARAQGQIPVAGSERRSAVLAHPLDLRPETKECSIHPAAVLVDVDPAGGTLDPSVAVRADPQLAARLASLRTDGVAIGWISASSADRAGDLRRALVASGLDPEGHDQLVLLRYPDERKQTRREDFAKEFCLVAIAGDERSDFDELFQYIKNPFLAAPLDALLGNGWFLIPQPLT